MTRDPLEGIRTLLAESAEQITAIEAVYQGSLAAKKLPPGLPVKVKNALENQRSALDYLAHELVTAYGVDGKRTAYPLAPTGNKWAKSQHEDLPGLAESRPDVVDAIEQFQPYQPGCEWLENLRDSVNPLKHRTLVPLVRKEQRHVTVSAPGGASVTWGPGVTFGAGVSVMGAPIDPRTQMPVPTRGVDVNETIYVDWHWEGTEKSVIGTLKAIQEGVEMVIHGVSAVAGWA